MAYEIDDIRTSQELFYYLLENHELSEEKQVNLYRAYTENELVKNLVKSQGELSKCNIERYGNVIYLIPKEDNLFLGYSKAQLKGILCKSTGTDKDYYLSQFLIITLLVEFYDGQGATSKTRDYMKVGELQNCISTRLKEGIDNLSPDDEDNKGLAFSNMFEAYEALKSDEKGSRARTTKEGFIYNVLIFMQKQGLIEYVEEDEMIKTTRKLDNFMDWNLLNQNNFERINCIFKENRENSN